jgi:hypothetical protein
LLEGLLHGAHRVLEAPWEGVTRLVRLWIARLVVAVLDGLERLGRAVAPHVPRAELLDAAKHGLRRHAGPEGERLVEPARIELARDARLRGKDGLHLAREEQRPAVVAEVERPYPESIAREDELFRLGIPERHRPLSVHALERRVAPLLVGVHDDLGVALGAKHVPVREELRAELHIVEDLAVERDPERAGFVRERLLPGRKVHDREARVREPCAAVTVESPFVRAAMVQGARHAQKGAPFRRRCRAGTKDPGDAAHCRVSGRERARPGGAAGGARAWRGAWPRCPCTRARPVRA